MDTNKEKEIEIGRDWDYNPLEKGQAIITESLARQLNVCFFISISSTMLCLLFQG